MSKDQDSDQLASRLLLDIKAVTIMHPSDLDLRQVLEKSLVDYSDDDVRRLTDAIRPTRHVNRSGSVLVAAGEIIFASFLAILGIGTFTFNMIGIESPQELFSYFAGSLAHTFGSSPLANVASIIALAFSILLIVGALYLLRRAATDLKEAGLIIERSGK